MNKFSIDDTIKIKGIAIILMIFHHLFWSRSFFSNYSVSFEPFGVNIITKIAIFCKICVPIFTFLSGYGLMYTYKKSKIKRTFWLQRYFKLMKPFWIIMLICYIYSFIKMNSIMNLFLQKGNFLTIIIYFLINISGFSGIVGTPNFCDHWWYIGASLVFIFLLPILYKLSKKYGWFIVGVGIIILPRIMGIANYSTTSAFPFIFSFYLGMYCQEKNIMIAIKKKWSENLLRKIAKFILYIIILILLLYINTYFSRNIIWEFSFGLTPFVYICFFYNYITNIPLISQILRKLGEKSLSMFMIHGFIISDYKSIIYDGNNFLLSLIIVIIISYIIGYFIEKIVNIKVYNIMINKLEDKVIENIKIRKKV